MGKLLVRALCGVHAMKPLPRTRGCVPGCACSGAWGCGERRGVRGGGAGAGVLVVGCCAWLWGCVGWWLGVGLVGGVVGVAVGRVWVWVGGVFVLCVLVVVSGLFVLLVSCVGCVVCVCLSFLVVVCLLLGVGGAWVCARRGLVCDESRWMWCA